MFIELSSMSLSSDLRNMKRTGPLPVLRFRCMDALGFKVRVDVLDDEEDDEDEDDEEEEDEDDDDEVEDDEEVEAVAGEAPLLPTRPPPCRLSLIEFFPVEHVVC